MKKEIRKVLRMAMENYAMVSCEDVIQPKEHHPDLGEFYNWARNCISFGIFNFANNRFDVLYIPENYEEEIGWNETKVKCGKKLKSAIEEFLFYFINEKEGELEIIRNRLFDK